MPKDENHDVGASGLPGLDHDAASGGFPLNAKLRDKLEKLAKWRIDLSSFEFPKDAPEFRGGNATVVKAFLISPSGGIDREDSYDPTKSRTLDPDSPEGETSSRRKPVAVKKMNISYERERVLGLTLREAGFLVDLSHENIIKLEGFVENISEDTIWLVFPWEDNGTLRDFIASAEWEIPERISLINDVAKGVEYLHRRQPPIRHGDLKSINILVNRKCRAVITDFGSARRLATNDLDKEMRQTENKPQAALSLEATFCSSTNTMGITLTGDNYTLRWAPPEVLREEEPILESDIWALGWVAYEPIIVPTPIRTTEIVASMARSPALLMQLGDMYKRQGDYANALDFFTKALDGYRHMDNSHGRAVVLFRLAEVHRHQGGYSEAMTFYSEALQIRTDIGDRQGRAFTLCGLAELHRLRAEYNQAVTLYSEALQIQTDIGDRARSAEALWGLAEVHRARGEHNQAVTLYSEALQICTDKGDKRGRADALLGLADVYRTQNEYNQAVNFYSQVLQIRTAMGHKRGRADALQGLGEMHWLQKEYSQAIAVSSESLEIYNEIGDQYGKALALVNLAEVYRDQSNYSDAGCRYTEAAEIFQQIGDTRNVAYASAQAAKVHQLSKRDQEEAT